MIVILANKSPPFHLCSSANKREKGVALKKNNEPCTTSSVMKNQILTHERDRTGVITQFPPCSSPVPVAAGFEPVKLANSPSVISGGGRRRGCGTK